MCTNFDDFWKKAVDILNKKIIVAGGKFEMDNWTVAGRYKRDKIPITKASEDGITCLTEKGENLSVSRNDLKYTYCIWHDYYNKNVLRKQIRDNIRTSVFTICTIHYLMSEMHN